jgi:hypothetical protein
MLGPAPAERRVRGSVVIPAPLVGPPSLRSGDRSKGRRDTPAGFLELFPQRRSQLRISTGSDAVASVGQGDAGSSSPLPQPYTKPCTKHGCTRFVQHAIFVAMFFEMGRVPPNLRKFYHAHATAHTPKRTLRAPFAPLRGPLRVRLASLATRRRQPHISTVPLAVARIASTRTLLFLRN